MTPEAALSDVRVVDLSQVLAGPVCTAFLGDLGADVVKIEPTGGGEPFRNRSRELNGEPFAPLFEQYNRNKRSLCLDVKSDEGTQVLHDLVAEADVFLQNFGPGVAERIGVDYGTLREVNEGLVYLQITGYGEEGPMAGRPAFDGLIQHAAGLSSLHGFEGDPPILAQSWLTDYFAGYNAALSALAALHHRERGGGGQKCSVSMFDSLVHNMNGVFEYFNNLGEPPQRAGTTGGTRDSEILYGGVEVEDGWIGVAFFPHYPNVWKGFLELVDRPELAEKERFSTADKRRQDEQLRELNAVFEEWLADRTVEEAVETLNEHSIPAAKHRTVPEVTGMDHVEETGTFVDVEHPRLGEVTLTDTPFDLSETDAEIREPAPVLGQHNREVLREAGYSADEIDDLHRDGVLEEGDV
jgi:crotonobetainyl-CoA:carnitine CoA-transferase CaiB-like acyl-CoA transferase